MTNLEHYQSMSAEEFEKMFYGALCMSIPCPEFGDCNVCILDHLNAEYEQEENT